MHSSTLTGVFSYVLTFKLTSTYEFLHSHLVHEVTSPQAFEGLCVALQYYYFIKYDANVFVDAMRVVLFAERTVPWLRWITMSRVFFFVVNDLCRTGVYPSTYRTHTRKNFTSIKGFVEEPESRAQCVTLEDNVKEFGVTYFGMTDRRQGPLSQFHISLVVADSNEMQALFISLAPSKVLLYATSSSLWYLLNVSLQLPGITCVCGDSHTSSGSIFHV